MAMSTGSRQITVQSRFCAPPRPAVPVRHLLGYGIGFGVLQFFFLYWGMDAGMPPGLASLVLQCSAPFTVILAALFTGESLGKTRVVGIALAVAGLTVVGSQRARVNEIWPFTLVILGGLGWAFGNLASRAAKPENPLHFTLWMSVVPPLPMLLIAAIWEGADRMSQSLLASALSTAAVVVGERINTMDFAGCLMVLLGVVVASLSSRVGKFVPAAVVPTVNGHVR